MAINTNTRGRTLSVQKILVGDVEVTPIGEKIDGKNVTTNTLLFGGETYENEHTMSDNLKYRFETTTLKLRGATILVSTHDALFGDSSSQRYPKSSGTTFAVGDVDLSTLYIKNATPGQNTKINVIGVKL